MNYQNPNLISTLAAEYVLGTLHGPARQRFERLLRNEASVRADVYFWEMRLGEMAPVVPAVTPPASVWTDLRSRMDRELGREFESGKVVRLHAPVVPRRVGASRAWRIFAGLAAAAGVVLAMLFGQQQHSARPSQIASITNPGLKNPGSGPELVQDQHVPIYVTLLKVPGSSMQWLVSQSADQRQLTVVAAGDYPQAGNGKIQLWWISQHSPPVALGTLPNRSGASTDIAIPKELVADKDSEFNLAVSLEPEGTSPADLPNGPVLATARNLSHVPANMGGI